MPAGIALEDVTKVYVAGATNVVALDGASCRISAGKFTAIVGPSGSGKTTLLNLIGGIDEPTSGRVIVGDRDIWGLSDDDLSRFRRTEIGFVFQFFNLLSGLTAEENVALPLLLDGHSMKGCFERARALLEMVGLEDRRGHLPDQLSGGESQRVAIARALAADPPNILADEPTGNLDTTASEQVLGLLRRTVDELNRTLIVVTHNDSVAALADEVITLSDGVLTTRAGSSGSLKPA
ncbi:MAG: ABC transporter ATP-binding protein [Dehalococcoidia bacterium]